MWDSNIQYPAGPVVDVPPENSSRRELGKNAQKIGPFRTARQTLTRSGELLSVKKKKTHRHEPRLRESTGTLRTRLAKENPLAQHNWLLPINSTGKKRKTKNELPFLREGCSLTTRTDTLCGGVGGTEMTRVARGGEPGVKIRRECGRKGGGGVPVFKRGIAYKAQ